MEQIKQVPPNGILSDPILIILPQGRNADGIYKFSSMTNKWIKIMNYLNYFQRTLY